MHLLAIPQTERFRHMANVRRELAKLGSTTSDRHAKCFEHIPDFRMIDRVLGKSGLRKEPASWFAEPGCLFCSSKEEDSTQVNARRINPSHPRSCPQRFYTGLL